MYISDLDGTLLNEESGLSGFAKSNLNQMLAEGLPFTVASARSVKSMHSYFKGVCLEPPRDRFIDKIMMCYSSALSGYC